MPEIWEICNGKKNVKAIFCKAWRIVENQTQTGTRKLVDSLQEQEVLEHLIEHHKPTIPEFCTGYHYLLTTPFRYPPLEYGSRFGSRHEQSLWYGSLLIQTALAEKAYYRFHFLRGSDASYEEVPVKYSAFNAQVKSSNGIDLTDDTFKKYESEISNPHSYSVSQNLGTQMRNAKVEVFIYQSARCPQRGKNIGLFTTKGFKEKEPCEPFQIWQGIVNTSKTKIEFVRMNGLHKENIEFDIDQFMIGGVLPDPTT